MTWWSDPLSNIHSQHPTHRCEWRVILMDLVEVCMNLKQGPPSVQDRELENVLSIMCAPQAVFVRPLHYPSLCVLFAWIICNCYVSEMHSTCLYCPLFSPTPPFSPPSPLFVALLLSAPSPDWCLLLRMGLKDPAWCGRVLETPTRGQKTVNPLKGDAPIGAHMRR